MLNKSRSIFNGLFTLKINYYLQRMSSNQVRIAVCQLNSRDNKQENIQISKQLIQQAKQEQAKIIFFPEAFDYICENKLKTIEQSETIDGPILTEFRNLAKENQLWISLGGFHLRSKDGSRILNSHLMINSDGIIVGQYSKVHLFDVQTDSLIIKESDYTESGLAIIEPIETPVGRIALGICYDVRFGEFARLLTLSEDKGAQILTYPSSVRFES